MELIGNYNKACTEVVEILKSLPKEQYERIPESEIEYYKKNSDSNYSFSFDAKLPLEKQNILRETYAILVTIYRDYFLEDNQNIVLEDILDINDLKKG